MTARVLFIGLDAAEPDLLRTGIEHNTLPALASLQSAGASGALGNCMLTLPGAVWPEISSGVSCGRLPRFFHPRQVITGDAAARPLRADDVRDDPTFWRAAGDQGRLVAAVDIPHAPPCASLNGSQVFEYGLHDTHFGAASHPEGLLDELRSRHGIYPVVSCDHRGGTIRSDLALLEDLLLGIDRKTALLLDLLARQKWDLFACAFSESHCGGHWFWRYFDDHHHDFDASAPPPLRTAMMTVYRKLDRAIAALVEAADPETTVVLASHGMAPYVAGYQLLPEVLARLGFSSSAPGRGSVLRTAQATVKHWVPRHHWERLGRLVVENRVVRSVVRPLQRSAGAMFFPLESPQTRAAYVPNNTIGAIRLNLRGREPHGCVEPGAEAEAVMDELRSELLALRHPASGDAIISSVESARELFGNEHHADVPDLIVRFRQDLGLLEECESARVGRVHVPVGSRWGRRSGDHSPRSAVWITGRNYPPGASLGRGSLLDIAPTVLAELGCQIPAYVEGSPLGTLAADE